MKYSELPKEYKKLADKYNHYGYINKANILGLRFNWSISDEGHDFWNKVVLASSVDELPHIPFELAINVDSTEYYESGTQVGGDHYTNLKIQPLDIILANDLNFLEGNVIKYVLRHRNKGMENDLRKAIDCLEKLIDHEYGGG